MSCPNWMLRVCRRLLGKKRSKKKIFFHLFGQRTESFGLLTNSFQRGCQNFVIRVHRIALMEKIFWAKYLHFKIFSQEANIIGFPLDFFLAGLSKLHSWCREEHFEEKIFLGKNYKFFSSFFLHCAKTVWPSGKFFLTEMFLNCILHVHKNIFRKNFLT